MLKVKTSGVTHHHPIILILVHQSLILIHRAQATTSRSGTSTVAMGIFPAVATPLQLLPKS